MQLGRLFYSVATHNIHDTRLFLSRFFCKPSGQNLCQCPDTLLGREEVKMTVTMCYPFRFWEHLFFILSNIKGEARYSLKDVCVSEGNKNMWAVDFSYITHLSLRSVLNTLVMLLSFSTIFPDFTINLTGFGKSFTWRKEKKLKQKPRASDGP